MKAYDVKVKLLDFEPLTYRQLLIPEDILFYELDNVLKTVWGFKGFHLSKFSIGNDIVIMDGDLNSDAEFTHNSKTTFLMEFFDNYKRIDYCYDFADKWRFSLEVLDKIDYDKDYVTIKNYEGQWNLLEDCGGVSMYRTVVYYAEGYFYSKVSSISIFVENLEKFDADYIQELLTNKDYVEFQFNF